MFFRSFTQIFCPMNTRLIRCLAAVLAVAAAPLVEAQPYDASAGNFNWLFAPYTTAVAPAAGAAALPYGPPTTQGTAGNQISNQSILPQTVGSNFQGVGQVAGSSSAKAVATVPTYTYAGTYPATATNSIVLENSFFGGAFASGVPRYFMGDLITPPLVKVDGVTPAPAGYWRTKPVEPGELITLSVNVLTSSTVSRIVTLASVPQGVGIGSVLLGQAITAISGTTLTLAGNASNTYTAATAVAVTGAIPTAIYSVNVTACSTDSKKVTVASVTPGVVVGATLLGEPITAISGTLITLAGTANQTITTSTAVTVTPALSYYYSPHAEKVYASQPGRVQITWVTLAALEPPAAGGAYGVSTETFSVSSNTAAKVRTIYWTERGFDGPAVPVTDGRITTVNPVFNSSVPKAVAEEVDVPGRETKPGEENYTTLSFDKYNGQGVIHAYNVEGRILVEYLGNVRLGNNVYDSLGVDVVDMVRAPDINYTTVHLGKTLAPHDGDASLTASPLSSTQAGATSYYGTTAKADGTVEYTAERESGSANSPDNGSPSSPDAYNKVVFYWLEEGSFGMKWPKYQDRYWLRWSPHLADYAHNTVDAAGSTADNGLQFTDGVLPQLVYQDDGNQVEAKIDDTTQRLYVGFGAGSDLRNRSLLKFTNTGEIWYVNLYTQAETRSLALPSASVTANGVTTVTVSSAMGLEVGMIVTGSGISGTATIGSILDGTRYTLNRAVATNLPTIPNPSFEQSVAQSLPSLAAIPGWTFTGAYGVNDINGPFADNGTIPDGKNVAFMQGAGSGTTTVTGLVAGSSYDIEFSVNKRYNGGSTATVGYTISVDNISKLSEPVTTLGYQTKTVSFTANGATASLKFDTTTVGDASLLLDNLKIRQTLNYTVEADLSAPINGTATVGTRLTAPGGHEIAGYISAGTGYYPAGYVDPSVVGVAAANAGAIIPVNAQPADKVLTVRWFKKIAAPSAKFKDLYVPGKVGRYTVSYPVAPSQIVIAQGVGTGDLSGEQGAGAVYVQNDYKQPGYNPNEEHAFMMNGTPSRAYALRDDLNIHPPVSGYLASNYTSEPYVLVAYTSATDQRPAMHAYQVVRSNASFSFDYTATAGTLLVKPYPLPLLPLAMTGAGAEREAKDVEILTAVDAPSNTGFRADPAYSSFTFEDRKGFTWVHRGPHREPLQVVSTSTGTTTVTVADTTGLSVGMVVSGSGITGSPSVVSINSAAKTLVLSQSTTALNQSWTYSASPVPSLSMKLYYTSQDGFFIPQTDRTATQPAVGTVLPFLRNPARTGQFLSKDSIDAYATTTLGTDEVDAPLTITYRPAWPKDAPELRVGETLALPKFGLPQIRGQKSAQVYYQQSVAKDTTNSFTKNSVTLLDPTREKTVAIETAGLSKLPSSIATTVYQGKTYFQKLPPDLQQRFYFDPMRGSKGTLVLKGVFHDEAAGEDYFDLNVLTAAQQTEINKLATAEDADQTKWLTAVKTLKTTLETFIEDPLKLGTYKVDTDSAKAVGVYAAGDNTAILPVWFGTKGYPLFTNSWYNQTSRTYSPVIAAIEHADTAVDSYALTATGQGTGYVTMVFGNGAAFTPTGDPVQVKVLKVSNQLYTGDLKVIGSSNPLDEQVTLRHSADFAGKPDDYEYDWRWATGAASSPAIYSTVMTTRMGDPTAGPQNWNIVSDPGALIASDAQYAAAGVALPLPRSVNVRPVDFLLDAQNQPTTDVIEATSYTETEKAAGYPALMLKYSAGVTLSAPIPAKIVFSATLGDYDGFVLYVNRKAALAFNAPGDLFTPVGASTGLTTSGLSKQFSLNPGYFSVGANTIEVALYSDADPNTTSNLNFKLEAAQESDLVVSGSTWMTPGDYNPNTGVDSVNSNTAIIGGSPDNPFGGPAFVLNDRWFTMRYRPKASAGNVLGTPWSRWMPPQFTEGWVKRVLAAINPFEQRVKDLSNNAVNTDVSVITQAGTRWEGDLALNMDNINDAGLIAIYETVLNRAKSMSINANTNDPDTNNALILAAGYLNDLYTILGNEAYADAANATISLDAGAVNSSRFSFEGQVSSSLDEELALLHGRDDSVSPGVGTAPAYNRLYWNYTRGINSGEAIYANNYNIKEKVGSSTANGVVDEYDAQRMFPQGHGDAYGHYLTALTGYYRLLSNQNVTWTPRAEAVTVLGVPVTVDFQDERKFAAAAGNLVNTAQQVVALTYRRDYKDDPASGWTHFRDRTPANPQTGVTRKWGLKEEISRSTQGALVNWAMANAMLPDVDNYHTGIQKIDRTTVPELALLPAAADSLQTTLDNANAHLNPLGLSPGSIAFDIDPYFASSLGQELSRYQGMSHFAQIYDRALRSLNNAAGAFNQAAVMSGSLRDQTNAVDDYTTDIAMQEAAYVNQLIDVYGRPYSGEVGAGKLYAQGYAGPDLNHWFIVDRPNNLVDTFKAVTVTIKEATEIKEFTGNSIADVVAGYTANTSVTARDVTVNPSQFVQYNDVWQPDGVLGSRPETGELQSALQDAQQTLLAISEANVGFKKNLAEMNHKAAVFKGLVAMHKAANTELSSKQDDIMKLERQVRNLEISAQVTGDLSSAAMEYGSAIAEFFPLAVGFSNDVTSGARGGAMTAAIVTSGLLKYSAMLDQSSARFKQTRITGIQQQLDYNLQVIGFTQEQVQMAYELDAVYREVTTQANTLMQLSISHQSALQNVSNVVARGNRILREREVFRQRAAAVIQGYRTKDLTFRTFRNEALEQYRSLFDLASRYTYMAAKAYDYETGLLGSPQGQTVFSKIVASRSLGDLTDGVPQSTASTLGDAGLAGTMAQLNADFSVAEGRLGINNPDYYGTVFSLRQELFRIQDDPEITSDDDAWKQTLEQHTVSNLLADSDVATQCRNIRKPDGSAVLGIVIPFSTTIESGKNFFGLELSGGDHVYSTSSYATVISNAGIVLPGYVGMDASIGGPELDPTNAPYILSATPYVYLIPCGNDIMRAPPLGDTDTLRSWTVQDQALPLPYNLGRSDFNSNQYFSANGTLNEKPWIIRKHQAFRAVADKELFNAAPPLEYSSNRLIARSAWNTRWKIVIPAINLLTDEKAAIDRFVSSVTDVQLYLRTYSHSGN